MGKHHWFYSIRTQLIFSFVLAILIYAFTSFASFLSEQRLLGYVDHLLSKNVELNEYSNHVDSVLLYLENYLTTGNYDMLVNYHRESQQLEKTTEPILKRAENTSNALMLKNINTLTKSFLQEATKAVQAKRGRNSREYNQAFKETARYGEYIKWGINLVVSKQLPEDSRTYSKISDRLKTLQRTSLYLIIAALAFSMIISTWTTLTITKPLRDLAGFAESISQGNLSVQPLSVAPRSNDEIATVTHAFNKMVSSLVKLIGEIKEQSVLEKKIQEQELQNLSMKNFLREAELHALQSQINPHFLYNTLNAGMHMANIEGAEKTSFFIDNLAHLLRYNLKKLGSAVTLKEELSILDRYFRILQTRFGKDRFEFIYEIDESATNILVPNLTLQPLVENSFIHGLEDLEKPGRILIKVTNTDKNVFIIIQDNGKGIPPEKLTSLNEQRNVKGHTTGIGLFNVRERLRLFYGEEDLLKIDSIEEEGTTITVRLPKKEC